MQNIKAACEEQSLTVKSKKLKQEGTFCCTSLGTEASSEAFPTTTVIVLAVLLTPTTLLESHWCEPISAKSPF